MFNGKRLSNYENLFSSNKYDRRTYNSRPSISKTKTKTKKK